MGACETHSDDQRQGPHPKATTQGFLAADDPPPLVGVKLVRPRLRRKRLRLRALQLDTSHAPATVGSYEEAPRTAGPSTRTAHNTVGSKQRAPLTRAALMGAEMALAVGRDLTLVALVACISCHKPCPHVEWSTLVIVLFTLFGTPSDPVIGGW
jgi:hypothetical protein